MPELLRRVLANAVLLPAGRLMRPDHRKKANCDLSKYKLEAGY
jgi:hypothetical protein